MQSETDKIFQLLDTWKSQQASKEFAMEEIIRLREVAKPILLHELANLSSVYDYGLIGFLLRKLGGFTFDELIQLVQSRDAEISRRAAWTLGGFGRTAKIRVVETLTHPHPRVRECMLYAIQVTGEFPETAIPVLMELLEDPVPAVRRRALVTVKAIGTPLVPALLNLRRTSRNKEVRRIALIALLSIQPDLISEEDKELLKRLDRFWIPRDRPKPFSEGSWLVFPDADPVKIAALLGCTDLEPVPYSKGMAAVWGDHADKHPSAERPQDTRIFLSPTLNHRWRLAIGAWWGIHDDTSRERIHAVLQRLSAELGQAAAFSYSEMGWFGWTLAAQGKIFREYRYGYQSLYDLGTPVEPELGWLKAEQQSGDDPMFRSDWVPDIARSWGIFPEDISSKTPFSGTGYLLTTPYGREHGVPFGDLMYWNK